MLATIQQWSHTQNIYKGSNCNIIPTYELGYLSQYTDYELGNRVFIPSTSYQTITSPYITMSRSSDISGSHSREYEEESLLGYCALYLYPMALWS
jgi:hypothetical protein